MQPGLITQLTTLYGTTTFAADDSEDDEANYLVRWLQVTDPLGATERLESRDEAPGISGSDPADTIPVGISVGNSNLNWSDSFYWSKLAYMDAPGDYTKATVTNFLTGNGFDETEVVGSRKAALENRVWYLYPGQTNPEQTGTFNQPSAIARVLDSTNPSGSTQIYQFQYDSLGNRIEAVDPVGRATTYGYASNGIDVAGIYQENPSATGTDPLGEPADQVAAYAYDSQHDMVTGTDAAGQKTTYTYNGQGQTTSKTVWVGGVAQTGTWNYNGYGQLTSVVGPITSASTSYSYNSQNLVQTLTDSEGYGTSYSYDALDRPTLVTYPDGTTEQTIYNRRDVEWKKDRMNRWMHIPARSTRPADVCRGSRWEYDPIPILPVRGVVGDRGREWETRRRSCTMFNPD